MATTAIYKSVDFSTSSKQNSFVESAFFQALSPKTKDALRRASTTVSVKAGEVLFTEGQTAKGVFIITQGRVKLAASSSDGKTLILRIAKSGAVLAISSVVLEKPQETSAEVLENTTFSFIKRADLLSLMAEYGDLALQLAKELSLEYTSLCQELSTIGLQRSAVSRLAQLFVSWCDGVTPISGDIQIECTLTHEVIAQLIGTSRETVTRILHNLRTGEIATLKNDVLTIHDMPKLRALGN